MHRILFALALGAVLVSRAGAVVVTAPWTATIVGGPFDGTVGSGNFSYEDSVLVTGDEILDPLFGNLTIDFTIFGQSFTEADDVDFFDFPELEFQDFTPTFINYILAEEGSNPIEINEPGVRVIFLLNALTPMAGGGYSSTVSILYVPEAATIISTVPAIILMACRRRRTHHIARPGS